MKMIRAAIHQPNYLPWLGFFHKLLNCDVFVIYDTVQLPRGKSFVSRSAIKNSQGRCWLSVPVQGKSALAKIQDVQLDRSGVWIGKHLKTMEVSYRRAPYFSLYYPQIADVYSHGYAKLSDLNTGLIKLLAGFLQGEAEIVLASELQTEGTMDGGLTGILSLCEAVGAAEYITGEGAGSRRYMSDGAFGEKGIAVIWQKFTHPVYHQLWGEFIPRLSVLDLLFNYGPQARDILLA